MFKILVMPSPDHGILEFVNKSFFLSTGFRAITNNPAIRVIFGFREDVPLIYDKICMGRHCLPYAFIHQPKAEAATPAQPGRRCVSP